MLKSEPQKLFFGYGGQTKRVHRVKQLRPDLVMAESGSEAWARVRWDWETRSLQQYIQLMKDESKARCRTPGDRGMRALARSWHTREADEAAASERDSQGAEVSIFHNK